MDKKNNMNEIDKMWIGTPKKYTIKKQTDKHFFIKITQCPFSMIGIDDRIMCSRYDSESNTCNSADEREWEYCGKYREITRLM